jgi:hypothetical protein
VNGGAIEETVCDGAVVDLVKNRTLLAGQA